MDEKEQDNVAAFDTLFTTNQIQIMKALLPCFDRPIQKYLAIYIKYQELQYTISYLKNHPYPVCADSDRNIDIKKILPSLLPYCTDAQKEKVQQINQMLSSLETYQEMMEMMEMMQSVTESAQAGENGSGSDDCGENGMQTPGIDALLSMLSPEQQAMMELLKGGNSDESTAVDE